MKHVIFAALLFIVVALPIPRCYTVHRSSGSWLVCPGKANHYTFTKCSEKPPVSTVGRDRSQRQRR